MKYVPDGDATLYINGEKAGNPNADIFGLDATIPLMQSNDYRDRFVAEWAQTKIRLVKLKRMLQRHYEWTPGFKPECPTILLEKQARAMGQYLDMLEIRAEIEGIDLNIAEFMEGEI